MMMRLASSASARPVHVAAGARAVLLELLQIGVEMPEDVRLDLAPRLAQLPASRTSRRRRCARLPRMTSVAWRTLRRSCALASDALAASGNPAARGGIADANHRGRPAAPAGRQRERSRARWRQRTAGRRRRLQHAADLHQAGVVGRRRTPSAPVSSDAGDLVVDHRRRDVGVLDRERAAEAAALVAPRQRDELEAAHRLQQPHRLIGRCSERSE